MKKSIDKNLASKSWQERYHASEIFTLRCRIRDVPGMLGKLTSIIGAAGIHVGAINVAGLNSEHKIRDITVYCADEEHLEHLMAVLKKTEGIKVVSVRDEVLEIHRRGTIETRSRIPINNVDDLRMVYTPGVASVCRRILSNSEAAWEMTGICERVAIVSNGTAVLGLGDLGVRAALPVMESKAAILAEFVGISGQPILIDSKDVKTIIETVTRIASSLGAIQLEDISAPACFEIEEKLRQQLDIPVFHDDQHGTATVVLATLINALEQTNRRPEQCSALILGAGAAGYAIAKMFHRFGIADIVVYGSHGPVCRGRTERMDPDERHLAEITNKNNLKGSLAKGFKGKDIFVGVARPNIVTREMVGSMAKNSLVFPLSNPVGEISIDQAYQAGAAIAADGKAINNALAYPALFRGALDARAKDITFQMQIAASEELARLAPKGSLLPNVLDRKVYKKVAQAAASAWIKQRK